MNRASVILVGCGAPKRSMGWYHAEQLLAHRCPSAVLKYVVEPFYMNKNIDHDSTKTPGYGDFQAWRTKQEATGISFFSSVHDVPPPAKDELRMGLLSGRTADHPALLEASVQIGCQTIYLEKPGAPTVQELETMRDQAVAAGTKVYVGFNKQVSAYVTRTRQFAASQQPNNHCKVTFLHNNAYPNTQAELAECFARNSEGMLKNMAIHELALLVTYYGVTVDTIASVQADAAFSSCQTLRDPVSGKDFTDFDKLKFEITTKTGQSASVAADRCGGDDSVGIVTNAATGEELTRYSMPDAETIANIPALEAQYPGAMPYFFTQDPDYCLLKERIAKACVDGAEPEGVATIDTAIAALKLAEYLTPLLQKQLL